MARLCVFRSPEHEFVFKEAGLSVRTWEFLGGERGPMQVHLPRPQRCRIAGVTVKRSAFRQPIEPRGLWC